MTISIETLEIYLVYADATANSNKFWRAKVDNKTLEVQWGRVGYQPQTKLHSCSSGQQAIAKMQQLVGQKKSKGYRETTETLRGTSNSLTEARSLLNTMRVYVQQRDFDNVAYLHALNNYLRLVPTPLGMKLDPKTVYRSVRDIDYQISVLNQLALDSINTTYQNESASATQVTNSSKTEAVSLKAISKSLWRYLE